MVAALTILLPPLLLGPWLPFVDLVSFVGMNGYPPQLSYGPVHYATFQFTYVGHYAVSRLLSDLGVGVPYQIVVFYLVQAGVSFTVVWRLTTWLGGSLLFRSSALVVGVLAFWDGVFLWGGPLAYSLAATCITAATLLILHEALRAQRHLGLIIALLAGALVCHPFAAPFSLVACGMRILFVQNRRGQTCMIGAAILIAAFVIVRDSPPSEASASHTLRLLFGVERHQMWARLVGLFTQDEIFTRALFGEVPWYLQCFFLVMAGVHSVGFLASPVIAFRRHESITLRFVATLGTIIGMLYLFSWDSAASPIPEWPQRILTLYAPFTYISGIAALLWLWRSLAGPRLGSANAWKPLWALPVLFVIWVVAIQISIFRFGSVLGQNVRHLREGILNTGLQKAFVVVADVDSIQPFYLRAVPFVLFSDPALIARHILIDTEWHFQDRHPSRLVENWFDLGRERYLAKFTCRHSILGLNLEKQPADAFPILEGTNVNRWGAPPIMAREQSARGRTLFEAGFNGSALEHFNAAIHADKSFAGAWNDAGAVLVAEGKSDEAVQDFEAALARDPKFALAHQNLAIVLANTGQPQKALEHAEAALQLDPGLVTSRDLAARLRATPAEQSKAAK